jgi:putative oxidoreductase
MKYLALLGRIFFSVIFVAGGANDLAPAAAGYAQSAGVPMASVATPLAGVIAILGGLSVALGFKARWGAWLVVLFLVPVTLIMHAFWKVADPQAAQMQQIEFLKNLSMLGAALLIAQFGSGPASLKD